LLSAKNVDRPCSGGLDHGADDGAERLEFVGRKFHENAGHASKKARRTLATLETLVCETTDRFLDARIMCVENGAKRLEYRLLDTIVRHVRFQECVDLLRCFASRYPNPVEELLGVRISPAYRPRKVRGNGKTAGKRTDCERDLLRGEAAANGKAGGSENL
jgi:hypothetical protein